MRIVRLETRRLRWPLSGAGAARGRAERESIVVELVADDGRRGRGEAAPLPGVSRETIDDCAVALAAFEPTLPLEIDTEDDALDACTGVLAPAARFALESALFDVNVNANDADLRIAHVVDTVEEARIALATGAAALKLKIAPDRVAHIRDIAAVVARHDAGGHRRTTLRLDANRSFARADVPALVASLRDLPIEFIEEPCVDAASLPELGIPIALDESLAELASPPPGDKILILKPSVLGGFRACAALARGRDVVITHALEGPIGRRAVAAVAAMIASPRAAGIAGGGAIRSAVGGSIDEVTRALDAHEPLAILHERATADELARQRYILDETPLPPDTQFVLFTSGSTGAPKPVIITRALVDRAVAANATHLGWRDDAPSADPAGRRPPDDRWYLALSLAHAGGLAIVARCRDARVSITRSLDDATIASLVPTQLAALLDDPAWRPRPQLRAVLLGGAAAPRALLERAAARGVPFLTTYGMTETFGQVATAPLARAGDPDQPLVPLPGFTIAIDANGLVVVDGVTTRDLGRIDPDGTLVILGRSDDVIITGGENVHPATVEAALAATPGVRAAIAFGIPDATWGQLVAVAIATTPEFDERTAFAAWHRALPAHARPRRLAIVDALPLLPTGKLDRRTASALPMFPVGYDD